MKEILKILNNYSNDYRLYDRHRVDKAKINGFEIYFFKEVYEEKLDKTIEIFGVCRSPKVIGYIAREKTIDKFGCCYYDQFFKVKKKEVTVTAWEYNDEVFYESVYSDNLRY